MATLKLEIVTPEHNVFSGDVQSVIIPTVRGEIQVLPGHDTLMAMLKPGELRVLTGTEDKGMAVGEGFVEVTHEKISILTDLAIAEKEIDEAKTQEAIKRAEDAIRSKTLIGEELEATEAALARSVAQLHLVRKRKHL
ncbi:MAG: ATP synthase F1 subunit epsilon [Verrucomicrobiota bacterium]